MSEKAKVKQQVAVRWSVLLGGVGLVWLGLEGAAALLFRPLTGTDFPPPDLPVATSTRGADRAGREAAGLGFRDPSMVLHPYLGYVYQPRPADAATHPVPISADGFLDERRAARRRSASRVIVGVVGGSVAGQLGTHYIEQLRTALNGVEAFGARDVDIVRLGMPGYHQPQQLIQVATLLMRGGELDVLINIDGFNELAVPGALNVPRGAHPLHPMNWSMVAMDAPDLEMLRLSGALAYLRMKREDLRASFFTSFWSSSRLARLRWRLEDRRLEREIGAIAWQLQERPTGDVPYFVSGPTEDHDPPGGLLAQSIAVWSRGSQQLKALCDLHRAHYLHVLQPNQYLPGSKSLSVDERAVAIQDDSPYRPIVETGYPDLRARGQDLKKLGIAFVDLTQIFRDTPEPVYKDNCCHYNTLGNQLLAEAIARALDETLGSS